ncbi:MAG: DUF1569 domain-containing protein [Acidobacteriota bacterium]
MKSLLNQSDKQAVLERLRQVRPDSPRQWGKMNAHQMVCHLNDSFKAGTGEKAVSNRSNFISRSFMRWFALQVPLTWPKGVKTMPEMDQEIGGTKPDEFNRDIQELENTVERFSGIAVDFNWLPHPIFGDMSREEWLRWGYLHMDHHLRQFGV